MSLSSQDIPTFGHVSPETAFLVPDYPYGRKVRCEIRYWIESDQKKGYRFVSQTKNPSTLAWNAPKKSTYASIARCMYLDGQGHVQCAAVTEYTDAKDALAFARLLRSDRATDRGNERKKMLGNLITWAAHKVVFYQGCVQGKVKVEVRINGERQEPSPMAVMNDLAEFDAWTAVLDACKVDL